MFNPTSLLDQAQLRHQEMVKQAETERLYKQISGHQADLFEQVRIRLRAAVRKLQVRPDFVAPVFDKHQHGITRVR